LQPPAPSQSHVPTHAFAGTLSGRFAPTGVEHVPAAFAHDIQGVVHVSTQQVPSMQLPVRQSAPRPQVWPAILLQLPAPSHALVPVQAGLPFPSWTPLATIVVHVPVMHDRQGVVQVSKQQTLSTQLPDAQSVARPHTMPFALRQ
jgi:hypothetical protein